MGGVAVAVGPLVAGAVVVLFSTGVGGAEPVARTAEDSFRFVPGDVGAMVALVLVVLALAPLLARRGAPAALAGFSALGSVAAFSPGVLPLVNAVTGSGPILWRFLYCAPIPILVGLLLSLPVPRLGTSPGAVRSEGTAGSTTGSAAGRLARSPGPPCWCSPSSRRGLPIWSHTGHGGPVSVSDRPQWKLDVGALQDVRLLARRGPEGDVLLPPTRMKVLTMYTTDFFPLVPRDWFIRQIHEPKKDRKARKLLYDVAAAEAPLRRRRGRRRAGRLDVSLACTGRSPRRAKVVDLYASAGYTKVEQVGTMACATRPEPERSPRDRRCLVAILTALRPVAPSPALSGGTPPRVPTSVARGTRDHAVSGRRVRRPCRAAEDRDVVPPARAGRQPGRARRRRVLVPDPDGRQVFLATLHVTGRSTRWAARRRSPERLEGRAGRRPRPPRHQRGLQRAALPGQP